MQASVFPLKRIIIVVVSAAANGRGCATGYALYTSKSGLSRNTRKCLAVILAGMRLTACEPESAPRAHLATSAAHLLLSYLHTHIHRNQATIKNMC